MTNETSASETELDEAAAAHALADLERAAMEGEVVTPTELAEARERVTLASLWRKGQDARAQRAKHAREAEGAAAAKTAVSDLLREDESAVDHAARAVEAAIAALLEAVDERNARLSKAAGLYRSAGIPAPSPRQADPHDVEGLDTEFYAWFEDGMELRFIRAGGRSHNVIDRRRATIDALEAALQAQQLGRRIEIKD